jgi:hypothetical protein
MLGTYSPQTTSLTPALGWNNDYEHSNLQQKELVEKGEIFLILSVLFFFSCINSVHYYEQ